MSYSSGFSNPFGFAVTPMVKKLLVANVAAFLFLLAFGSVERYLVFTPYAVYLRPWTVVTYMFVHYDLFHLLFNMLALFFFGPPLEERWGSRGFLRFFFLAGAGGALLSLLMYLVFITFGLTSLAASQATIAGASGAVYGVLVAFAMYWPDNPIYFWGIFPIKAKYLVGFIVGIDLFFAVTGRDSNVAYLAHLGGAAAAFLYLRSRWAPSIRGETPRRSARGERGDRSNWNLLRRLTNRVRPAPQSDEPKPVRPVAVQPKPKPNSRSRSFDDVDRILDKISEGGISSLTPEERMRLEEASRRRRSN
jgi:membrane associated rhomboid family serine protease